MNKKIEHAVKVILDAFQKTVNPDAALKYTQAVLNLANAQRRIAGDGGEGPDASDAVSADGVELVTSRSTVLKRSSVPEDCIWIDTCGAGRGVADTLEAAGFPVRRLTVEQSLSLKRAAT